MKNKQIILEARVMLLADLKQLSIEKGLSTYKLAELTGITQANVHRIINGKYPPTLDTFLNLCQSLDCYVFIINKEQDDDLVTLMQSRWKRTADDS